MTTHHNVALLLEVRDQIQKEPKRFNMQFWLLGSDPDDDSFFRTVSKVRHDCGTVMCIGGWTETLVFSRIGGDQIIANLHNKDPVDVLKMAGLPAYEVVIDQSDNLAAMALGLTAEESDKLFCPEDYAVPGRYTAEDAVRTIDNLIATGEIEWDL